MKNATILFISILIFINTNAQMLLVFDTSLSDGTDISIKLSDNVDVVVDWGDGLIDSYTSSGHKDHYYFNEGIYTVSITGTVGRFNVFLGVEKLTKVLDFGELGITNMSYAFDSAVNLVEVPTTIPSSVTNMHDMFYNALSFNHDIGAWDVSNVTNMNSMFSYTSFDQDIGGWDVSNVTDMSRMFSNSHFNQDIGGWDVGNVTNMFYMFHLSRFDQNLGAWDISNVTDMKYMFTYGSLSTSNYDALLNGWAEQTVQEGVDFYGGSTKYTCNSEIAREALINESSWNIVDGGEVVIYLSVYGSVISTDATGTAYQWLDCNNDFSVIEGEVTNVFTATYDGDFAVEVTNNGCVDTSYCRNINYIGIDEIDRNEFDLYPNPTTGKFQIEGKDLAEIEILSATGHLIRTIKPSKQNANIDLSQEAKGVYFVKVLSEKGTMTTKLVLE